MKIRCFPKTNDVENGVYVIDDFSGGRSQSKRADTESMDFETSLVDSSSLSTIDAPPPSKRTKEAKRSLDNMLSKKMKDGLLNIAAVNISGVIAGDDAKLLSANDTDNGEDHGSIRKPVGSKSATVRCQLCSQLLKNDLAATTSHLTGCHSNDAPWHCSECGYSSFIQV